MRLSQILGEWHTGCYGPTTSFKTTKLSDIMCVHTQQCTLPTSHLPTIISTTTTTLFTNDMPTMT